jgi:hypothetical protein
MKCIRPNAARDQFHSSQLHASWRPRGTLFDKNIQRDDARGTNMDTTLQDLARISTADGAGPERRIVLLAGPVRFNDRRGHHDYVAGCRLLAELLSRSADVEPVVIERGWPDDESIFEDAATIVVYDGGGGKQGFLRNDSRVGVLDRAMRRGCGLVILHQGVGFPRERVELGRAWLGGVYAPGLSARGHWKTSHDRFPEHPVTRGVTAWQLTDGWLVGLVFVGKMHGVTPLVWAAKPQSAESRPEDIAAWAYDRPGGGRSFAYTGLDDHSAWHHEGLRRLVVNGVLWTAGAPVAQAGADVAMQADALDRFLSRRAAGRQRFVAVVRKRLAQLLGHQRRWGGHASGTPVRRSRIASDEHSGERIASTGTKKL